MKDDGTRVTGVLPLWAGRSAALLGILLVALNLRTAVASISPIIGHIDADVPLDTIVLAVIGMAPPLAFAASGILAPIIARHIGLERALLASVGLMIVGHLARALSPTPVSLVIASAVALIGVGIGNVLLPPLVKRYFPDRIGLVTSIYVTLMSISTAVPPMVAVPLADAAGWRVSLGIWFLVAVAAVAPWVTVLLRHRREANARSLDSESTQPVEEARPELIGALWRSPTAWAITIAFAISATTAYASFIWLPELLVDVAGTSPATAGLLLALFAFMGFPAGIGIPLLAARMRNVGLLVYAGAAFVVAASAGLLLAPQAAVVVWVAFAGLGTLLFPLSLVLIGLRTRSHEGAVALSGFVQAIGYTVGATGPLVVGLLHDVSGDWNLALVFLLAAGLAGIVPAILLARPSFVEDELLHRRGSKTKL